ncbi:MAG: 2-polyprenyl-6-methoxyphenol hydroxylase-like FAD-dependent oxidoreductase [Candidatus Woesearchaeota archaeon]|jgi:2-polyprenyl-6-methoxyphenol hydroxylase-like FAD-dependent oxidoreductase
MKILIVGAGPAGLTLGNFLDTKKHQVTIIERQKKFKTMGYGLYFLDEGKEIMKNVLSMHDFHKYSENINLKYYLNNNGETIVKQHHNTLFDVKKNHTITSITRGDLHKLLRKKLSKNIKINKGITISKIRNNKKSVKVTFSNKKTDTFELVVGSEGVHSPLRKKFFVSHYDEFPFNLRYLWMPNHSNKFQLVITRNSLLMYLPLKKKPIGLVYERLGEKDSYFDLRQYYRHYKFDMKKLKKAYDTSLITKTGYLYTESWFNNRIVLIGDAQHAMTPTQGYGTSLAIEDAHHLAMHLNKEDFDLQKDLTMFSKSREKRVRALRRQNKFVELLTFRNSKIYYYLYHNMKWMTVFLAYLIDLTSIFALKEDPFYKKKSKTGKSKQPNK